MLPFVACNSLQALPHKTSIGAVVVQFNLSPVLALCLFDCSSEGIAVFLISFRVRVPHLDSGRSIFYLSVNVACNPWLLFGVCTYGHCGDDVIYALTDEAND